MPSPPPPPLPLSLERKRQVVVLLLLLQLHLLLLALHNYYKRRLNLSLQLQLEEFIEEDDDSALGYNYVPPIRYSYKAVWSINGMGWNDIECKEFLRFTQEEIIRILAVLDLKDVKWRNRYRATPEEALCLVLYRLSYPTRYKDCLILFGKSRSWISTIFNDMVLLLVARFQEKLEWDSERLTLDKLRDYAGTIERACGVQGIWGFIDGTHRGIARPTIDQQDYYSGAKKEHGLRYQGIVTPDGLVSSLSGPWLGPLGDWTIWEASGIEDRLRDLFEPLPSAERLYVYGDPAYVPAFGIIGPFRRDGRLRLTPNEEAANVEMSRQRIVVEWAFGLATKYWSFGSFKPSQKSGLSPVASYYLCSILFTNMHTCLRGNQISVKYNISPPTLEDYLRPRSN